MNLLLSTVVALAADAGATNAAMDDYFAGEQRGGYVLVGMGVGGLLAGGLLRRSSSPTARGASYPLLGLGVVHAAAGIFIYIASDRRIDQFHEQIAKDPAAFIDTEQKRMKGVSTQFTALKIAEVVLIVGGLGMAAAGRRTDRPRLAGVGLALALEAGATLGFDVFAARRAHDYRDRLATLDVTAAIDPDTGAATALVITSGRF